MELALNPPASLPEPARNQQAEQSARVPSELDPLPPMDGQPVPYEVFIAMKTELEVRIERLEKYIFGG